jgi:hypothetical protein
MDFSILPEHRPDNVPGILGLAGSSIGSGILRQLQRRSGWSLLLLIKRLRYGHRHLVQGASHKLSTPVIKTLVPSAVFDASKRGSGNWALCSYSSQSNSWTAASREL